MSIEYKLPYTGNEINRKLGEIDNLAKKSEIPSRLSELTNDKGYTTESYVQTYSQPKGNYALNSDVPSIEGLASIEYVDNAISDIADMLGTSSPIGLIEPRDNDVPKIYITGILPENKEEVSAEMLYISKTETFHAYIMIKCQGTSSLSYSKKNFTIKMYEDKECTVKMYKAMKGWKENYKFVLKANWIDYSHARNIVSARLWSQIVESRSDYDTLPEELKNSPNNGAVDGFPIIVYCNGLYWGRYTWNIGKDGYLTNMDDSLDTHCLLCSENYYSGCFRATAVIDETDWTDELHKIAPENIVTSLNRAINFVMDSTDENFVANIENYFNLPSLIDYYIFCYAICHLDGLGKNQLLLTYDGVHWIASAYDMDSTFGLYWDGRSFVSHKYKMQEEYETGVNNTTNLLYERLGLLFSEQIKERYAELRKTVLNEINMIREFEKFTDLIPPYICAEDYASTTANGKFTGIPSTSSNNIGQIRQYIVNRLDYVDSMINSDITSGEKILRENYSPAGASWIDTATLDLNNGDYIEVSVNLSSCTNATENILSVGDTIGSWSQNVAGYHVYYSPNYSSGGVLQINALIGSTHNRKEINITSHPTIIRIEASGMYVDGTKVQTNSRLSEVSNLQIGSTEGSVRSKAVYNYIKVYKH